MIPSPRDGHTTDSPPVGGVEVDSERQAAAAVVAEAVALALEAVAAEAAKSVLVTAAAVTEATTRAAQAAESAKGARALAADAAAQSVAAEAARAATQVRVRAEAAAAQVRQAAVLAADKLAHSGEHGTEIDAGREANLLRATATSAAKANAEETTRAADAVTKADLAAAAQVAQTLAAEEEVVEHRVAATAEAQRELATATAADVAAETDARAAGIALAAREAAAALVDEPRARSISGDADLAEHELATPAREVRAPRRDRETAEILASAEERDSKAELRDQVAEARGRAASLRSFLADSTLEKREKHEQYAMALADQRAAALDRIDAKTDRTCAASDRARLSTQLSSGPGAGDGSGSPGMSEVAELSHHLRAPLRSIMASVEVLEVALRESDDRLRFLVDAVTDYAIISLDPEGIIESWNAGAERLEGYTPEEALGRHCSLFYTAEDRDSGLPQRLLARARAEHSCEHTGWRVRKDGSQFWGDVIISSAHDDTGNLTGFVEVVRDFTEQHRLEGDQNSFYNAFEHDFRVPMTAIKGFAELVTDADPAELQGLAERVESNANRLLGMVEELIDYARIRTGLGPISLRVVDMLALTQLAVANLASIAETSRVQVTATKPVTVVADPAALERVIANLVTNAVKYSPAESEINLICEQVEDVGVLRIVDRGRGIDKRDLGSIFLEFERGRLAQEDSGTGLGLASVQRLIGLQNGTVAITSEVDVGTTFTIELPLAP